MNRELLKGKADTLTDSEVSEVLEYISIMESVKQEGRKPDAIDDLILWLLFNAMTTGPGNAQRVWRQEAIIRN